MILHLVPHQIALLSALAAFGVAGAAGLACGVPVDHVVLRAILAAGAFWILGRLAGRMIVNLIIEAMSEHQEQLAARAPQDAAHATGKAPLRR